MAYENPVVIGIDFSKSPLLRVGGLVELNPRRYIVVEGPEIRDGWRRFPTGFEAVPGVVSSQMGGADIKAAVVVVPNTTSDGDRESAASFARAKEGINLLKVINEYQAAAAAYADKMKPNKAKALAVISTTSGYIDVCVVNVKPKDLLREIYEYSLQARVVHKERIDYAEYERQRRMASLQGQLAARLPVLGPLAQMAADKMNQAADVLRNLLNDSKLKETTAVDEVLFVGNVSTPKPLVRAVKDRYPDARMWDWIDPDEIAGYGGAVVAYDLTKPPLD